MHQQSNSAFSVTYLGAAQSCALQNVTLCAIYVPIQQLRQIKPDVTFVRVLALNDDLDGSSQEFRWMPRQGTAGGALQITM